MFAPANGCFEDYPFLLGPGLFLGAFAISFREVSPHFLFPAWRKSSSEATPFCKNLCLKTDVREWNLTCEAWKKLIGFLEPGHLVYRPGKKEGFRKEGHGKTPFFGVEVCFLSKQHMLLGHGCWTVFFCQTEVSVLSYVCAICFNPQGLHVWSPKKTLELQLIGRRVWPPIQILVA